jgi:hypothetical protein
VDVTIRAYDPADAADLTDVFFRSVRQVALSDYTPAQVRAWAPEPRTAEWARALATLLVADLNATTALQPPGVDVCLARRWATRPSPRATPG